MNSAARTTITSRVRGLVLLACAVATVAGITAAGHARAHADTDDSAGADVESVTAPFAVDQPDAPSADEATCDDGDAVCPDGEGADAPSLPPGGAPPSRGRGGIALNVPVGFPVGSAPAPEAPTAGDLALTKTGPTAVTGAPACTVARGFTTCTVDYTIVVTNIGDQALSGVTVTDRQTVAGAGFFVAPGTGTTSTGASCTTVGPAGGTETITCPIGTLGPGQSASISIRDTMTTPVGTTSTLTDIATVVPADATPSDNASTVTTTYG